MKLGPGRRETLARPAILAALGAALGAAAFCSPTAPRTVATPGLRIRAPSLEAPLSETVAAWPLPADAVKRAMLQAINADRVDWGLPAVAWDEPAARVADAFCARQVEEKSRGHFLTDGIPPYARTGFAGVFGLQSENSVSWITTASMFDQSAVRLALEGEKRMMEEKPPDDGHRRTILDPESTHVGVGYAVAHGRFQLAQEFLVRSLERLTLSLADPKKAVVRIEGAPRGSDRLRFVVLAREPEPCPLTREEATGRTSYSYPKPQLAYVPEGLRITRVEDLVNEDRIRVRNDGRFSFLFAPDRPGLYTLVFYTSRASEQARPRGSATVWVERTGA